MGNRGVNLNASGDKNAQQDRVAEEEVWEPSPIPESDFVGDEDWANINRSPYDQVSGVLYKRAMVIKSVTYEPLEPAPEMPAPWQGEGQTIVRWLFSEAAGTAEGLLQGRAFHALQELTLKPGAATGQQSHPGLDTILVILVGRGVLNHRPTEGSPVVARPLREGDAVLVSGDELYSIANSGLQAPLKALMLRLAAPENLD